jgi:SAM-dependent methyltransferase
MRENEAMAEFDAYIDSYIKEVNKSVRFSGGDVDYFTEYKVNKVKELLQGKHETKKPAILDFGCGLGLAEQYFEKYFPMCSLYGVDISPKSIEFCRRSVSSAAHFCTYDGQRLPFKTECFDIIFSAGTFHHIALSKHAAVMREIRRVLKVRGLFFLFELNKFNPAVRYISHKSRFDKNANLMAPHRMRQALKLAGFNDTQLRFIIFFPRWLEKRFRFLERYLEHVPIGAQYLFVSSKS